MEKTIDQIQNEINDTGKKLNKISTLPILNIAIIFGMFFIYTPDKMEVFNIGFKIPTKRTTNNY